MSDPHPPHATYDPNEIRRCIALCFSPNDLRTFAENLGVTQLGTWDRGIQDGAREVVRHFERLGTLDELIAKLAAARPLMEWPAPIANAPASPFAPAPPMAPPPATISSTTNPVAAALPNSFAPQVFPPPGGAAPTPTAPAKPTVAPTIPASEPVLRDPFAPSFPGTAGSQAATNPQRLEGKKLAPFIAAGVAMITIITIGIFLAVRVGKNPDPTPENTASGRPLRPTGPARMAADAMKRSLESLARGCDLEIPRGTDVDVWLFSAAYTDCGTRPGLAFPIPGLRNDKPRVQDSPPGAADPSEMTPAPNSTPRQANPGRDPAPRTAPAPVPAKPPASDGCIEKCSATQRQCNRGCGSEPTSGAGFDRWQGCQTQCLSAASKCRLACQ